MQLAEKLHAAIAEKVFVTNTERYIVSPNGEETKWLFDFRRILLTAEYLDATAELFWEHFKNRKRFQVGGLEVAAIPLIAAIVMKSVERGTPINGFFIRKSRKKSGLLNMIEGELTDEPIILVDDILNSGRSFERQIMVLEELEKRVSDVFTILRFRSEGAYPFLDQRNIVQTSLFSLPDFNLPFLSHGPRPQRQEPFDILWRFQSEDPNFFYVVPKSAPALDEERVYMGSDRGYFWALNQSDGSVAWKYKVGWHPKGKSIFSTPVVYNKAVYFGSYDGNVYALEVATGKRKWAFMEADWVGSSPALAPDINLLFIGLEFGLFKKHGGIVALDIHTGEKKWEYAMPMLTHCSPAYSARHQLVAIGSNDGVAYLFDATSGALRWKQHTEGEIKGAPTFDDARGYVLFASFDGGLYIYDVHTGTLVHRFSAEHGFYSIPLVENDHVYIGSFDKKLYAINLNTFEISWEFVTRGRIFASPVVVDGHIFIGANDGRLYEIDAKTGKEINYCQVSERITNKIAYNPVTKHFFLPTFANELYCLKRKQSELDTLLPSSEE